MTSFSPFLFFLFVSCASQPKEIRKTQASRIQNQKALQILNQLEQQLKMNNRAAAKVSLRYLENHYRNFDVLQKAYLIVGDFYYNYKDYKQALHFYRSILDAKIFSSATSAAWMKAILSAQHANLGGQVEELSERALVSPHLYPKDRSRLYKLRHQFFTQNKKWNLLLRDYLSIFKSNDLHQDKDKGLYWKKALQLVKQKFSLKELQILLKDPYLKKDLEVPIHFRLALIQMEQRQHTFVLKHLDRVLFLTQGAKKEGKQGQSSSSPSPSSFPMSPLLSTPSFHLHPHPKVNKSLTLLRQAAQTLKMEIQSLQEVKAKSLGLILPLTGKHAARGRQVLDAVRLGLSLYGSKPSSIQLVIRDSEGQADVAEQAVEDLVKKNHVMAIMGSLLSRTASAVAHKAQELRIPCISFSQKRDLAKEGGPFVFQHALTSYRQVSFLVQTLRAKHNIKSFALLYPQDSYGEEFVPLFLDAVQKVGGYLRGAQSYSPEQRDFRIHIKKLLGIYYKEDRLEEYQLLLKQWQKENPQSNFKKQSSLEELLPPIVDFQGLFIPDNVEILAQVASTLVYYNVKKVFLLGTNLWDTPDLARNLKGLKGIQVFFVNNIVPDRDRWKQMPFFRLYKEMTQKEPGVLELNAYEVASILREIIVHNNINSRYGLLNKLKKMKSFSGVLGQLYLSEYGEIYRPPSLVKHAAKTSF